MTKTTTTTTTTTTLSRDWRPDLRSPLVLGLLALLGLQLVLALGLSLSASRSAAPTPRTPLLGITPEQVERLVIEEGGSTGERLVMTRRDAAHWALSDLGDAPAAGTKISQLLEQLAALQRALPVATTAAARERFKVADETFERRLTIEGKFGNRTLILGDSPGFRRIFARLKDDEAVYELPLALADIPARPDDWVDASLLQLEQESITQISGEGWRLNKSDGDWKLADAAADEALDQTAAKDLALRLATLAYRGLLTAAPPEDQQEAPRVTLEVTLDDGSQRRYQIAKRAGADDYVVQVSDLPQVFRAADFDVQALLEVTRDSLLLKETAPAETPAVPNEAAPAAPVVPAEPGTPDAAAAPPAPQPAAASAPAAVTEPAAPAEMPAVPATSAAPEAANAAVPATGGPPQPPTP